MSKIKSFVEGDEWGENETSNRICKTENKEPDNNEPDINNKEAEKKENEKLKEKYSKSTDSNKENSKASEEQSQERKIIPWWKKARTRLEIYKQPDDEFYVMSYIGEKYETFVYSWELACDNSNDEYKRIEFSDISDDEDNIDFEESKFYDPENYEMNYAIAKFMWERKRYEDVIKYSKICVKEEINENNIFRISFAYLWMGKSEEKLMKYGEAVAHYAKAAGFTKDNLWKKVRQSFGKYYFDFNSTPEHELNIALERMGCCYRALGKYEKALNAFEEYKNVSHSNEYDQDIELLKKFNTVENAKEEYANRLNEGKTFFENKEYLLALKEFQTAYKLVPDNLEVLKFIAKTYRKLILNADKKNEVVDQTREKIVLNKLKQACEYELEGFNKLSNVEKNIYMILNDSEEYMEKGIQLSSYKDDKEYLGIFYEGLGDYYFYVNKNHKFIIKYFLKAKEFYGKEFSRNKDLLIKLGKTYECKYNYSNKENRIAAEYFRKALLLVNADGIETIGNSEIQNEVLENIEMEKQDSSFSSEKLKAIEYYRTAIKLSESELGCELVDALDNFEKAADLLPDNLKYNYKYFCFMQDNYVHEIDPERYIDIGLRTFDLAKKQNDENIMFDIAFELAEVFRSQKNYKRSVAFSNIVLDLKPDEKKSNAEILLLALSYEELGEFSKALNTYILCDDRYNRSKIVQEYIDNNMSLDEVNELKKIDSIKCELGISGMRYTDEAAKEAYALYMESERIFNEECKGKDFKENMIKAADLMKKASLKIPMSNFLRTKKNSMLSLAERIDPNILIKEKKKELENLKDTKDTKKIEGVYYRLALDSDLLKDYQAAADYYYKLIELIPAKEHYYGSLADALKKAEKYEEAYNVLLNAEKNNVEIYNKKVFEYGVLARKNQNDKLQK